MKQKMILFASALVLIFSASAAQAHGSLFGVFFKHHYHNACGYHHNDHRPCHVHKPKKVKKHYGYYHKPKKVKKHYGYYHKHHYHHGHKGQLIW